MKGILWNQYKLQPVTTPPDFTKAPTDYFDFWYCLKAFGKSLGTSDLVEYKGAFFRRRNKQLTLCSYTCSGVILLNTIQELQADGYTIKTINFVNKDFNGLTTRFYANEFYLTGERYSIDDALCRSPHEQHSRKKMAREYRVAASRFSTDVKGLNPQESKTLFNEWATAAKARHFMVVTGHYLQYLHMLLNESICVHTLGFRENATGKLWGIAGWEYAVNGTAQITLAKHLTTQYEFSGYFWITVLNAILERRPYPEKPGFIFCGTTADVLKQRIGLDSRRSFKIVIPKGEED